MRTEVAEWDRDGARWQPGRIFTDVAFDRAMRVTEHVHHNPDGSLARQTFHYDERGRLIEERFASTTGAPILRNVFSYDDHGRALMTKRVEPDGTERVSETCSYDGTGRRTKVRFLPPGPAGMAVSYGIEGSEHAYGAPGATTMTLMYDAQDRSSEALLRDSNDALVRRITLTRDNDGRVVTENCELADNAPFDLGPAPETVSAEDRAKLAALLAVAFGSIRTAYVYDKTGRLLERSRQMGALSEEHSAFHYDDHDNPVEESTISHNREMNLDDSGQPRASAHTIRRHDIRFAYQYDVRGNWTERVVSNRFEADAPFQRSNVERRTITYYEDRG